MPAASAAVQHATVDGAQLLGLLAGGVSSSRLVRLIQQHGISFHLTDDYLGNIRIAGGDEALVTALRQASRRNRSRTGTIHASESEALRYVARCGELRELGSYSEGERA